MNNTILTIELKVKRKHFKLQATFRYDFTIFIQIWDSSAIRKLFSKVLFNMKT